MRGLPYRPHWVYSTYMTTKTLRDMLAEQFTKSVARTARDFRDLADQIEREAKQIDHVPSPGSTSGAAIAARIVHSITWGLANASPDQIVSSAAEFDFHLKDNATTPETTP